MHEPVVGADDLASNLRWPEYGPGAAAAFGIGSQIGFQFNAKPHARGALNLYGHEAHQLDLETRQLGAMFAGLVALALGRARQDATMTEALAAHSAIGQAIGILMERYRLDPDRAFAFLLRTSQAGNIKLSEVAGGVIANAVDKAE